MATDPTRPGFRKHRGHLRLVTRVATAAEQAAAEAEDVNGWFRSSDKWTKKLMWELERLEYDWSPDADADADEAGTLVRVYLTNVGRDRWTLVLRVVPFEDGGKIERVLHGRDSWTARQAYLVLHKKASRTPRYFR
jgi:hypothetical protein